MTSVTNCCVGLRPVGQQDRMVIANMVYQGPLGRWPITPQQRFENFAMLRTCLNLRVAIQTLPFEQGVVILPVTIKEIGDEGILGFLD